MNGTGAINYSRSNALYNLTHCVFLFYKNIFSTLHQVICNTRAFVDSNALVCLYILNAPLKKCMLKHIPTHLC